MENFDAAINAIVSAKFVVEQADEEYIYPAAGFVLRTLADEAYRAIMEAREEFLRLQESHAELWKEHLEASEAKPEWIVEKPVPVGSEAAHKICQKVREDNTPQKKKGRTKKA